jgi:hypothetical protein
MTISELKACAQRLYGVEPGDRDDTFYEDVEALRDELVLRSRGGGAGNAGVREPRRPVPSGDAAEIALEPPAEGMHNAARPAGASWIYRPWRMPRSS